MNKLVLPSLAVAFAAFSHLGAQSIPPVAPAPPAAPQAVPRPPVAAAAPRVAKPATEPPNDPFVRDQKAAKAPAPPVSDSPVAPVNVLTTIETWALSQEDFTALMDGPANERAPYDRLEALANGGKAKLVGLIGLVTKSGQRAVTESIDEVRYATEFTPAARTGEIPFPTAYETRNAGDTFELEPIIGPDEKTIEINGVPQSTRLEGFLDWQPEAGVAPTGQPQFRTEKLTSSMTVISGRPAFLATATPEQPGEGQGAKQIQIRVLRATNQKVQPAPATSPVDGPMEVRVEFLLYTLDREAARGILNDSADSAQGYAAVRALVAKGEAQLETVNAFMTKSGQRGVNQESAEFRYATNFVSPKFDSQTTPKENRQPASSVTFETRNAGVTVEIEPVVGPDGRLVDVNVVPQVVRMIGMLKVNGVAEKYPAQPVFSMRRVTTSVSGASGVPALLGTLSQPRDSGVNDRKDDGRTGLAYIRVTAVSP